MIRETIIGASGLVGSQLLVEAERSGAEAVGTYCRHPAPGLVALDITDPEAVSAFLKEYRPDVLYLPAALPNVDWAEEHPEESTRVNVDAPLELVRRLEGTRTLLVYYSSDYVFDGRSGPYKEEDRPNPVNEYGRQKLRVENAVESALEFWLILRLTVVYGWEMQGKNFVQRSLNRLSRGETIRAPADQIGSPTWSPNMARASRELALSGRTGLYHLAGRDLASRYEFARAIARVFGYDEALVEPIDTPSLGQKAERPLKAGMIVDKVQAVLSTRLVGIADGLAAMRREGIVHGGVP
jgi:dTDP-4-dehydrorhamnose reductase